jgi:hypothetical protein
MQVERLFDSTRAFEHYCDGSRRHAHVSVVDEICLRQE